MTAGIDVEKLQGFSAIAKRGRYQECRIEVEVNNPQLILFIIEGTPKGAIERVAWEASATDYEGVIEWLEEFGLLDQAWQYASQE